MPKDHSHHHNRIYVAETAGDGEQQTVLKDIFLTEDLEVGTEEQGQVGQEPRIPRRCGYANPESPLAAIAECVTDG